MRSEALAHTLSTSYGPCPDAIGKPTVIALTCLLHCYGIHLAGTPRYCPFPPSSTHKSQAPRFKQSARKQRRYRASQEQSKRSVTHNHDRAEPDLHVGQPGNPNANTPEGVAHSEPDLMPGEDTNPNMYTPEGVAHTEPESTPGDGRN